MIFRRVNNGLVFGGTDLEGFLSSLMSMVAVVAQYLFRYLYEEPGVQLQCKKNWLKQMDQGHILSSQMPPQDIRSYFSVCVHRSLSRSISIHRSRLQCVCWHVCFEYGVTRGFIFWDLATVSAYEGSTARSPVLACPPAPGVWE